MVAGCLSDQAACVHLHKPQLAEIGFFQQLQNGVDVILSCHVAILRSGLCSRTLYNYYALIATTFDNRKVSKNPQKNWIFSTEKEKIIKKSAKRLLGVVFTLALMTILACGAFAAKPAVEVMVTRINTDSVGGVSPSIGYRNNSGKTIKYIDFTMVPYNAVGDPVSCTIRGYSSAVGEVTGPIETFAIDTDSTLHTITKIGMSDSNPFKTYRELTHNYTIDDGKNSLWPVYVDQYGSCFVENLWVDATQGQTYLTDDEVQNATYLRTDKRDCLWYNSSIRSIKVTKAVVTYMDARLAISTRAHQKTSTYHVAFPFSCFISPSRPPCLAG